MENHNNSNPDENVATGYVVPPLSNLFHLQLVALAGRAVTMPLSYSCHLLDLYNMRESNMKNSIRNQYSPWHISMTLLMILKDDKSLYVENILHCYSTDNFQYRYLITILVCLLFYYFLFYFFFISFEVCMSQNISVISVIGCRLDNPVYDFQQSQGLFCFTTMSRQAVWNICAR